MTKRLGVAAIVVVALAAGGFLVWKSRGRSEPASGAKAGSGSPAIAVATGTNTAATAQPATAIVTVKGGTGPLAGATVRFAREGGDVLTVDAGADGAAKAAALEPGTWTISASAAGHEPGAVAARELHAGETVRIDITLTAGGRALTGVVTDATGGPIAGARIDAAKVGALAARREVGAAIASTLTGAKGEYTLSVAEGQLLVAASNPDGTFRIEAKAGKSGLVVMTPPAPTTRMGLVLEPGKTLDVGTITIAAPPP